MELTLGGADVAANGKVDGKAKVKPRLRGVSHEVGFYLAVLAGAWLVWSARSATAAWAGGIYAASLAGLLGISALYHRPTWSPVARARMRRLDHAAIYLLIGGTATPLLLLALPPERAPFALVAVWSGAVLGILKSLFWVHAPKVLNAALYLALGWGLAAFVPQMRAILSGLDVVLLVAGGLAYSAGAVVYAVRRPDPFPTVFGYHEIFHALVLVAAVCHFTVVRSLLVR